MIERNYNNLDLFYTSTACCFYSFLDTRSGLVQGRHEAEGLLAQPQKVLFVLPTVSYSLLHLPGQRERNKGNKSGTTSAAGDGAINLVATGG